MKYLWISPAGETSAIAAKVVAEGNDVRFHIPPQLGEAARYARYTSKIGDGIVDKVGSWQAHVSWADVVVIDTTGQNINLPTGDIADSLRRRGKKVIAAGAEGEKLELDRHFGQDVLRAHGVQTIPIYKFSGSAGVFDKAADAIRANPAKYVFKPDVSADSELTYCATEDDSSDLVSELPHLAKLWPKGKPVKFELQEYRDGVEVDVGGFFSAKLGDWMRPLWVQFQHKKCACGDEYYPKGMGFNVGEMGSTSYWLKEYSCKFHNEGLDKLKGYLSKIGFTGWCDITAIANEEGLWPLEFTVRFGLPEVFVVGETLQQEWGKLLSDLVEGQKKDFGYYEGWGAVCRLVCAGFPFCDEVIKRSNGKPIKGYMRHTLEHLYPEEARITEKEGLVNACVVGVPLSVTARGKTLDVALDLMYQRIAPMASSTYWYRPDIGKTNIDDLQKLHVWGYNCHAPGLD